MGPACPFRSKHINENRDLVVGNLFISGQSILFSARQITIKSTQYIKSKLALFSKFAYIVRCKEIIRLQALRNTVPLERHSFYLLCYILFQLKNSQSGGLNVKARGWLKSSLVCFQTIQDGSNRLWIDYYFISSWYERKVFLLDKVHSTNLERFTRLFICGMN